METNRETLEIIENISIGHIISETLLLPFHQIALHPCSAVELLYGDPLPVHGDVGHVLRHGGRRGEAGGPKDRTHRPLLPGDLGQLRQRLYHSTPTGHRRPDLQVYL